MAIPAGTAILSQNKANSVLGLERIKNIKSPHKLRLKRTNENSLLGKLFASLFKTSIARVSPIPKATKGGSEYKTLDSG